jgi:hypothetical protein
MSFLKATTENKKQEEELPKRTSELDKINTTQHLKLPTSQQPPQTAISLPPQDPIVN